MLHALKRHPIPVAAEFDFCLVLTYALPERVLAPLLPPGLVVDAFEDLGFVAIAMVQTRRLRPAFLPRTFGWDFFLSGYRIFSRFSPASRSSMRGLHILRSDTDNPLMTATGNLLTHYRYVRSDVDVVDAEGELRIRVRTPSAEADLEVAANLASKPGALPAGSPFPSLKAARQFAGPLPQTFSYEPETHSLISVRGVRSDWDPQPVEVEVRQTRFFEQPCFAGAVPVLANAFHMSGVPYRWEAGVRHCLDAVPSGPRDVRSAA